MIEYITFLKRVILENTKDEESNKECDNTFNKG